MLERNKVGIVRLEEFGKIQKLAGIAGKPREFGEDQGLDVSPPHIRLHAFRLGVLGDTLSADPGQSPFKKT
jgi:hypothetical protein